MTIHHGDVTGRRHRDDGALLTRLSWLMVPVFLLVWIVVGSALFYALKGPLGLQEGEVLLMARSAAGWLAEVGSFLLTAAAPVAGVAYGVAGVRRGGGRLPAAAAAVNGALFLLVLYTFIDDIHMTYFPGWW